MGAILCQKEYGKVPEKKSVAYINWFVFVDS